MATLNSCGVRARPSLSRNAALTACALLACSGTALAQPAGVTVTDLGNFAGSAGTTQTQNVSITAAAPVAWFKIRLPRITAPHRYLDISTSGVGFADTELGLFAADGALIATDDDDGAQNFSALSFGITSVNAAGRVPPIADAGQTAGAPNDGRDSSLSGNPQVGLLGTAADYYISVSRFDSSFGNSFGVTPPVGGSTLATLLTIRMNTPSGQIAPSVVGQDVQRVLGDTGYSVFAFATPDTSQIFVDASSVGGATAEELGYDEIDEVWAGSGELSPPLQTLGNFPLVFRASNAIGDVTIDNAVFRVSPTNFNCGRANQRPIATISGTTLYTYDTRFAYVDGPWTNACSSFTPTGNDVWFEFVPTQSGTVSLSTCNSDTGAVGGQPDTLLGFRGRCDDAGFSTCGDDVGGCGLGTRLTNIPVTAGLEYNIAVRSWSGDIVNGKIAVTFTPLRCTLSDVAGPGQVVGPDNALTADDIIVFLNWFFAGNPNADVAGPGQSTTPDAAFTADDIIVFLNRFFAGC